MSIKVKTPNTAWEGECAGVKFFRGEGIFEDEALGRRIAESLGYEVVEEVTEPRKSVKAKK